MSSILASLMDFADLAATPLGPSHYLGLFNPLWASHRLSARVVSVWDETSDVRTLTLKPGRSFTRHRAGQHVRVGVEIDGRMLTRTYSISSSPARADGLITITVKAQGVVSRFLVRNVQPGDYLSLGQPEGDFVLPETETRPVFITAGSGVTPVMSMLRTFALRGAMPDVAHVHYAPRARDVIFGSELGALAAQYPSYRLSIIHTREHGHFRCEHLPADHRERTLWACGPESLLQALPKGAHSERFRAPKAAPRGDERGGKLHLRVSGVVTHADTETPLLQVAERAGVNPAYGCRRGICHTCDTTLLSGRVRDLRSGELVEAGARVSLCVCAAASDVELEL